MSDDRQHSLLGTLTDQQFEKYFPDRQFVERRQTERMVRNPGTGEMVQARIWLPIEELKPVRPESEYPTETELRALDEIEWVNLHFDFASLTSLIGYLIDPDDWTNKSRHVYQEFRRFQTHPGIQYEYIYLVSAEFHEALSRIDQLDVAAAISKAPTNGQYYFRYVESSDLRNAIADMAKRAISGESKLILWDRGMFY